MDGDALFQQLRLLCLSLGHQQADLLHDGLARQRHERRAGGRETLGLTQRNGLFENREPGRDQWRDGVQPLLLLGVVGSQAAQVGQTASDLGQTGLIGLQIVGLAGNDEAALPGLRVFQTGQQITQLLDHLPGMPFPTLGLGSGLQVSPGEPANASQTAQDKHQQGCHQMAFKSHHQPPPPPPDGQGGLRAGLEGHTARLDGVGTDLLQFAWRIKTGGHGGLTSRLAARCVKVLIRAYRGDLSAVATSECKT